MIARLKMVDCMLHLLRINVSDVGLMMVLAPIEVSQELQVLLSLDPPDGKELEVDLEPDKDEEKSGQDGNYAEHRAEGEVVADQQVEEEDQAAEDEEEKEDEMEDEPGEDQSDAEVDPADHKEDVGQEPGEVEAESPAKDREALLGGEEGGAGHDAGGDEDEDEDGRQPQGEIHQTETGAESLQ